MTREQHVLSRLALGMFGIAAFGFCFGIQVIVVGGLIGGLLPFIALQVLEVKLK